MTQAGKAASAGGYSPERATAVHEAGHAVMAYLLGRAFTEISIIEDSDSYGRVRHRMPGGWFRPDIEVNSRARAMIEDRVMILLAGSVAERAWYVRLPDAPDGWEDRVQDGADNDERSAIDLADYVCGGSVPELEAYVEWLRQRVLGFTGRGPDFDVTVFYPDPPAFLVKHYQEGDERFWAMVTALATAVQSAGSLSWRRAKDIMREADPLFARIRGRGSVFAQSEP
jgi:hypothetical protein